MVDQELLGAALGAISVANMIGIFYTISAHNRLDKLKANHTKAIKSLGIAMTTQGFIAVICLGSFGYLML